MTVSRSAQVVMKPVVRTPQEGNDCERYFPGVPFEMILSNNAIFGRAHVAVEFLSPLIMGPEKVTVLPSCLTSVQSSGKVATKHGCHLDSGFGAFDHNISRGPVRECNVDCSDRINSLAKVQ